jgi:hypothetical protein
MYGQNREGHTVLVPVLFLSLALLPPAAAHTKNLSLVNKQRFNTSTHALLKYFIKFSVAEPEPDAMRLRKEMRSIHSLS